MSTTPLRIGIVGGGIGGLTLALALRRRGLAADVNEQAAELREMGAAVALSANATRELERLGLLDAIAAQSAEPSELIWRGWRDDARVESFPVALGGAYRTRFGAPYFGIHRADLQKVLGSAHGAGRLHLAHRLVALTEQASGLELTFANGYRTIVEILIGADGVRSSAGAALNETCAQAAQVLVATHRRRGSSRTADRTLRGRLRACQWRDRSSHRRALRWLADVRGERARQR